MSVNARPAAGSAEGNVAGGEPAPTPPDAAGRLLRRLSVLPALLVMAWLLVGLPLLLSGFFTPVAMLALSVPLAVVLVAIGLRWLPGRWPGAGPAAAPGQVATPWWTVAAVVAIAIAFGVDQMIYHSQFIIVTRDPASYIQFANWISKHGSLPIPQGTAAFGGTHHGLTFASFAFYQVGTSIVPQFMAGLPMILAGGFWIGGVNAAVAMAPILGACAVLTFAGLAARLVGPRWAPLAALILAVSLPEEFTSRSTYSEPVAQILFLGGLCLVIDSLGEDRAGARVIAALGGLALGLTLLVRIDGASDILPVIPYCGMLLVGRSRQAVPLVGGLMAGGLYGSIDGLVLSRPYLASIRSSLVPLALITGVVIIATLAGMAWFWDKGLPKVRGKWLPNAAAALAFVVVIGLTLRPYFQTARRNSGAFFDSIIAGYQRADHVPVQPERLYYEISMHWVFWYIGVPAVALGTIGAAVLARRCLRGQAPTWVLPLMIFAWAIVTTLYDPAITPDHPWASRRLVPTVLPGFILLAIWGTDWLLDRVRRMDVPRALLVSLAACGVVILLLPATITTFGLRARSGGPVGIKIAAVGLAFKTTYGGEIPAVNSLCAAIPRDATVVFIDSGGGGEGSRLTEVVRGMCGVPVADINRAHAGITQQVVRGIERAGRRPVFLAGTRKPLVQFGGPIRQVMRLRSTQDMNALTAPPLHTLPFNVNVWMSEPTQ
ncbi:MAG TPA: hypothetical protein VMC83_33025 [Streptosporangiaceae bacterium]|nr:hypothetical protein [Streptosporangiaceae bacterium]